MSFSLHTCYQKQIWKSSDTPSGPLEWIISNLSILACQGQRFTAASWFTTELHVLAKMNQHIFIL